MAERKLTRIPAQGTIAGVCAGLAKYFDIDVSLVRVGFVLATAHCLYDRNHDTCT